MPAKMIRRIHSAVSALYKPPLRTDYPLINVRYRGINIVGHHYIIFWACSNVAFEDDMNIVRVSFLLCFLVLSSVSSDLLVALLQLVLFVLLHSTAHSLIGKEYAC